jgi:mono/diheme cytochrome c family protein
MTATKPLLQSVAGLLGAALLSLALAGSAFAQLAPSGASTNATTLKLVSEFDRIENKQERAAALFIEAGKVISSPRCQNCHPGGERPTQTDAMTPHQPWVIRGADGFGAPAMRCATCHQAANFESSGVPGHPKWHLAPASMAWQGKSLAQICEQIKDKSRNDNMDLAALVKHMSEDTLVGWAWKPGGNRTPAPGTQTQFGALIRAWAEAGAYCPK